ncbi:MAG: penicillin-binding transpeptidase domain-containing protein [Chloroflexota bacterium]
MAWTTTRLLLIAALLAACTPPTADPRPSPSSTPSPSQVADAARLVARKFVADWRARDYEQMVQLIAPADRARYTPAVIIGLLRQFDDLAGVTRLVADAGPAIRASLPADGVVEGPVPAFEVPISFAFDTDRFGHFAFRRMLILTEAAGGWEARWRPSVLFPGLAADDTLVLQRTPSPRGRIVSVSGAVFADTRADGKRVYPQEWLAGQTIGYATPATAQDVAALPKSADYQVGEPIGRSGLEQGAQALLRGTPGLVLAAVTPGGARLTLLDRPMIPGANLTITIRPDLQATAEAALAPYADAATAVIDPKSGDIWALASAPLFNPNSMTIGTTLGGRALARGSAAAQFNRAVLAAMPAGSSFKPFTLLAALKSGAATPSTRMSCNGTWVYDGFTFHNYKDHHLAGLVSLAEAMAFSCNTTYMPLSIRVWQVSRTALTDIVGDFGFGRSAGIPHLADNSGVLPDAQYFEVTPRGGGRFSPYGPFDQIQLAIGQGSFLGTPLQLANAYAAFGNGGTLWAPRLVTLATLPDGRVLERNDAHVIRQIDIAPQHLAFLAQTLRAVITLPYGTANQAFAGFGIQVAGKSGTAETGTPRPDAWFPAYAPIGGARIAVATVLVHVKLATGGTDAAPLVRRVMSRYFFP